MISTRGDLFSYADSHWLVVPTNIGYKSDGTNPMGVGVAKEAARRWPDLPRWYGRICQKHGAGTGVVEYTDGRFYLVPTKRFNDKSPHLSWKSQSDLWLIAKGVRQLAEMAAGPTALPLLGCGAGGLHKKEVLPILEQYLDDRFLLVS